MVVILQTLLLHVVCVYHHYYYIASSLLPCPRQLPTQAVEPLINQSVIFVFVERMTLAFWDVKSWKSAFGTPKLVHYSGAISIVSTTCIYMYITQDIRLKGGGVQK